MWRLIKHREVSVANIGNAEYRRCRGRRGRCKALVTSIHPVRSPRRGRARRRPPSSGARQPAVTTAPIGQSPPLPLRCQRPRPFGMLRPGPGAIAILWRLMKHSEVSVVTIGNAEEDRRCRGRRGRCKAPSTGIHPVRSPLRDRRARRRPPSSGAPAAFECRTDAGVATRILPSARVRDGLQQLALGPEVSDGAIGCGDLRARNFLQGAGLVVGLARGQPDYAEGALPKT
mmetsp:Transcript_89112/g.288161  ORF Transcript_89112/g.288161 Transcript_89112/m.288161 type:complete len:230 (+) Transcript_89112:145-834(+)